MHKKYGINISILCSNILISYSIMCISKYNHNIIYYFGKLGINLCLGEIIDIKQNKDDNINNYINCIEKKTASLFELCTYIGSCIGNGNKREINSMKRFGMYFGISYQLIDDLLEDINFIFDKKSNYHSNSLFSIYLKHTNKKNSLNKCIKIIRKYLMYANNELLIFKDKNKAKIKLKQLINYLENIIKKIIKEYHV